MLAIVASIFSTSLISLVQADVEVAGSADAAATGNVSAGTDAARAKMARRLSSVGDMLHSPCV
jgi:hypothetical protein